MVVKSSADSVREPSRLRRLGSFIVGGLCATTAIGAISALIVVTKPDIIRTETIIAPPPPSSSEAVLSAIADDHGAVIVEIERKGFALRGQTRDGRVEWSKRFSFPSYPLSCGPCPAALVVSQQGALKRVDGSGVKSIFSSREAGAPPNRTFGMPAAGAPTNRPLWFARASESTLLAYVPKPTIVTQTPLRLLLTPDQERDSSLAVDSEGRNAVVVSHPLNPLKVGELRLLRVANAPNASVTTEVALKLRNPNDPYQAGPCISEDGRSIGLIVPHMEGSVFMSGSFDSRALRRSEVPIGHPSALYGCAIAGSEAILYGGIPGKDTGLRALWLNGTARKARDVSGVQLLSATVCSRTGELVVVGQDDGVAVLGPTTFRRFRHAVTGGCTPGGVPWLLDRGRVKWLPH